MAPTCFCDAIKPITLFCQCVGLLPLKFGKHAACSSSSATSTLGITIPAKALNMNMLDNPSPPDALACGHNFKFRWISWPSFVNAIWIAGFTATALWVQIHLPAILQQRYIGIDLYVQYVPLFTTYYELVLILLLTRWKATEIAEVWVKTGEIFHVIKTNRRVPALMPIMFQAWLLLALTILPSVGYMYNAIILPGNVWPKLVQCLPAVFFTAFAIHFLTLCTILRFLNRELSAWLGQALKAVASTSTKSICLQTIRLAHADLSRAVAMASDCFGMQALILMCTIVVSVTLNAYKIMSIAPSMQGESKGLPYLWGFYLYFEIFALTCLLMGGQFVKDLVANVLRIKSALTGLALLIRLFYCYLHRATFPAR